MDTETAGGRGQGPGVGGRRLAALAAFLRNKANWNGSGFGMSGLRRRGGDWRWFGLNGGGRGCWWDLRNKANSFGSGFGVNGLRRCGVDWRGFGWRLVPGVGGKPLILQALEVAKGGAIGAFTGIDAALEAGESLVELGVNGPEGVTLFEVAGVNLVAAVRLGDFLEAVKPKLTLDLIEAAESPLGANEGID
jgi:hypothetical protein